MVNGCKVFSLDFFSYLLVISYKKGVKMENTSMYFLTFFSNKIFDGCRLKDS